MKYFIETSILIAAAIPQHENNKLATSLLKECKSKGEITCLSTHVLAEMYANLTRLGRRADPKYPLGPTIQLIRRTIFEMHTVILSEEDYYAAMERCVTQGLSGAVIYDALHFQAALKIGADVLYTDNLRDFNRLITDDKLVIKGVRSR